MAIAIAAAGIVALVWNTETARGDFHAVEVSGQGTAVLTRSLLLGARLRLSGVRGAERTEVRLIAASDAWDTPTAATASFVRLGKLDGRAADFEIPRHVDLDRYRAVVLWSDRDRTNCMTAPLRTTGRGLGQ